MNGPTEQFDEIEKMELEVDTVITEVEDSAADDCGRAWPNYLIRT